MRVEIRCDGTPLPLLEHGAQIYAVAPRDGSYTIELYNDSAKRVEAVVTVDGASVLDGKPASHDAQGYVVAPWSKAVIPGWRRSDDEVARFTFCAKGENYTAKMDQGVANTGVIGVAVFEEYEHTPVVIYRYISPSRPIVIEPWNYPRIWPCGTLMSDEPAVQSHTAECNSAFSSSSMKMTLCSASMPVVDTPAPARKSRKVMRSSRKASVSHDLGTGYGRKAEHKVRRVHFTRASSSPSEIITIEYATREALAAAGVDLSQMAQSQASSPQAFPAQCPAPEEWSG